MRRSALVAAVLLLFATVASAQTLDDLKNDGKNSDNILTYGMGYQQHRYSPLKQINKSNLKRLVPIWNLSLDNNWGEQAQPLVYNGVMYVTNARATVAIDVATGKQLWRRYTIPARGEKGNETWPQNNNAWEVGGGSSWITGSYDPELDLAYWGVGNPAPWASQSRPGDNLYTSSVLALRPKTGEIVWYYQFTPGDAYDYDASWELILSDINVAGQRRKVLMQLNRNGFLYVIDRTNGKLISAKAYEKVNWASHVDMTTGRPVETEVAKKLRASEQVELWPSTTGGKNWPHAAYNPNTGLLYANTIHQARMFRHLETKPHVPGQRYQFVENLPIPKKPGEPHGHIDAIDPLTAEKKWRVPLMDFQIWSAMLATGGGLLFTGNTTGEFIALDAVNGKQLWQFQTGSGINAMPVTFTHNNRQYVTVLSGLGGLYWNQQRERLKDIVPQGGSVWTFALMED